MIEKSVDIGLPMARLKLTVTNQGVDLEHNAWWGYLEPGARERHLAYADSGQRQTIDAGTYGIGVFYSDDDVRIERWLVDQKLEGEIERTIELSADIAELMVAVTINGERADDA